MMRTTSSAELGRSSGSLLKQLIVRSDNTLGTADSQSTRGVGHLVDVFSIFLTKVPLNGVCPVMPRTSLHRAVDIE